MINVEYINLNQQNSIATLLMTSKTGIINDLRMLNHKSTRKHPENPARVKAIMKMLQEKKYLCHPRVDYIDSYDRLATNDELSLAYPQKYIKYVQNLWPKSSHRLDLTVLDTYFNQHSQKIARLAAGGVLQAIDRVVDGRWQNGYSVIRPPGHHSGSRNTINGFCIFNNVAIGARYLQTKHQKKRIAIIDWDIHFGDGTHHIFLEDEDVLFFSIHRYDYGSYYPSGEAGGYLNCGKGTAEGTKVNIPLNFLNKKRKEYPFQAPGDNEYIYIYNRIIHPILREFNPQFIIISSGFDAARYDYLGGFTVTPNGYFYMMKKVLELQKPTLAVLQGGYNYRSTAQASVAVVKALLGQQQFPETVKQLNYEQLGDYCHLEEQYHEQVDQIIAHHSKWWKSLLDPEQIRYTERIKDNKTKLFGVVEGQHQTSSSSSQPSQQQTKSKKKDSTKPQENSQTDSIEKKQQKEIEIFSAQQSRNRQQQSTTQFYFAGGHIQRFKNFSVNNQRVHKWAYPQEIAFYEKQLPEHAFTPKYFGCNGEYIVIQNLLYQQKDHVVMDIKLSRMSKYPHNSEDKIEKEKKKEAMSTSQKYAFRIGGFTTPLYKQGGLLIADEAVVSRLLAKVVTEDNRQLFCDFLQKMSEKLKEVKRKYFGTSVVLVRGKDKSAIRWIDFHYWLDDQQGYDVDLVEGIQNLHKFIASVQKTANS